MRQSPLANRITQNGYTLVLVTVFLFILGAASIQFFNQSTESVKISGASRDSTQSLVIAEAAMEYLRGKFINDLDTNATTKVSSCETNAITLDKCEASTIQKNITDPNSSLFHYMYYINDSSAPNNQGITEIIPDILQTVATNEKTIMPPDDITTVTPSLSGPVVAKGQTNLGINDLFVNSTQHPFLFGVDEDGALSVVDFSSDLSKWTNAWFRDDEFGLQNLKSHMKAAAWFEIIKNPDDPTSVDVFVQAASQVGYAKSYTQRYVGSYFNSSELGDIALLSEATNPTQ
jgi:hypothetical protein